MIINRRKFLKASLAAAGSAMIAGGLRPSFSFSQTFSSEPFYLIWINQLGGADMKAILPYTKGAIHSLLAGYRPNINPSSPLTLGSFNQNGRSNLRGFNPGFADLVTYLNTNTDIGCTIVSETGITKNHSFSHEIAQQSIIAASALNENQLIGGWFARLIDTLKLQSAQAWSIGYNNSFFLNSQTQPAMVLSSLENFNFRERNFGNFQCLEGTCEGAAITSGDRTSSGGDDSTLARAFARELNNQRDEVAFDDALKRFSEGIFPSVELISNANTIIPSHAISGFRPGGIYVNTSSRFQNSLLDIARVITLARQGDAPIQLRNSSLFFATAIGGWDTHNNQANSANLSRTVAILGAAIKGLLESLKNAGALNRAAIIVQSEFGRTARENGSQGTDHGWGSDMLVLGGKVFRGVLGPESEIRGNNFVAAQSHTNVLKAVLRQAGLNNDQLMQIFPDIYPGEVNLPLFI
jgi:uncharacterized protein (DUF1501 family)